MGKSTDKMMPATFSPLHVNPEMVDGDKLLALYQFARIFFPQLGPGLLNLLLDMESHARRMVAAITPEEREQLIRDLDRVVVELKCMIKDKGQEMMTIPVTFLPAEVLRRAAAGKPVTHGWEKQQKEMERVIIALIEKEIQRKMKLVLEACLKPLMVKPRLPAMLKELISRGLVNRDGRLAADATIMDLMSGRYARLFANRVPGEVLNEAWLIQKTLQACARRPSEPEEDYQALVQEALRSQRMLEITLKAIQQKQHQEKRSAP